MPTFSSSEIEEAKRRVREMQSKADSYVSNPREREKVNNEKPHEEKKQEEKERDGIDKKEEAPTGDSSFLTILIILMLLSHEGADNKLLLALLYLLL